MKLENQVAIVTASGRNIGEAIAHLLATEGARVTIADIDEERGSRVARDINERGGQAISVLTDVTRSTQVQTMVRRVVDEWGRIDILVNNAGFSDRVTLLDLSEEEWDRVFDITLKSAFMCTKYVAQQMVQQGHGGKIVNVASDIADRGETHRLAYTVAKAGVMSLTRGSAVQLAPHNIRVNCISPGQTGSSVGKDVIPPEGRSFKNLVGRLGDPMDQANAVLFLVSDDSTFIDRNILTVDNGTVVMQ